MAIYLTLTNQLLMLADNLHIASTETGAFRDATFRTAMLNLGQKAFNRDTRALGGNLSTALTSVAEQQEYDLWTITDFEMVDKKSGGVLFDSVEIDFKTPAQLVSEYGKNWYAATSGNPTKWYLRGKRYLGLYVKPSSTYASETISVYYIKRPADMSAGTDTPFDSSPYMEEYTEAPVIWATWKLFGRKRQYDEAALFKKQYYEMVALCSQDLGTDECEKAYFKPLTYR